MIDTPIEEFTAQEAAELGLVKAIEKGEVKISGTYEITPDGKLKFEQKNFTFKDKFGNLRSGRFKDDFDITDLADFWDWFSEEFK